MKQTKTGKLCPAYNPAPMSVVQVKVSTITANSPVLGSKTRNSSHFRKVTHHDETESTIENSDYSQDVPEIITVNNDELNQDCSDNSNVTDVSAGRPKRRTRMPARYKDFISKCIYIYIYIYTIVLYNYMCKNEAEWSECNYDVK